MNEKILVTNIYTNLNISKIRDYITLTKPRLLSSVLFSTAVGYILPANNVATVSPLIYLLFGTTLLGAGAHTLNQWMEQVPDSKMQRTKNRPLPNGRLSKNGALIFGTFISIAGITTLWMSINLLTAAIGLLTIISYLLIYTPLKKKTIANTWVGGITGALPPVIGWSAAKGTLDLEVLPIFVLLYFWQLPHFFAIAWMYRDDYRSGGFKMLSLEDTTGKRTSFQMLLYGGLLFFPSTAIFVIGQGSLFYLLSSIILGLAFLAVIFLFFRKSNFENARKVFLASIIYLPLLSSIIIMDRFIY